MQGYSSFGENPIVDYRSIQIKVFLVPNTLRGTRSVMDVKETNNLHVYGD